MVRTFIYLGKTYTTLLIVAFMATVSSACFGQKATLPIATAFKPNHWSFTVGLTCYAKTAHALYRGEKDLEFFPAVSVVVGASYTRMFRNNLGFRLGVTWGLLPLNYRVKISAENLSPTLRHYGDQIQWLMSHDINFWSFPLQLVYRIPLKKQFEVNFAIGAAVDFFADGIMQSSFYIDDYNTGQKQNLYTDQVDVNIERLVFMSLPIDITVRRVFKNKHSINFGFSTSIMFQSPGTGRYSILPDAPDYSSGHFFLSNTYAAIKIGYTFQQRKKPKANLPQRLE